MLAPGEAAAGAGGTLVAAVPAGVGEAVRADGAPGPAVPAGVGEAV
jgi:hypothetical protein